MPDMAQTGEYSNKEEGLNVGEFVLGIGYASVGGGRQRSAIVVWPFL